MFANSNSKNSDDFKDQTPMIKEINVVAVAKYSSI